MYKNKTKIKWGKECSEFKKERKKNYRHRLFSLFPFVHLYETSDYFQLISACMHSRYWRNVTHTKDNVCLKNSLCVCYVRT